MSGHISGLLVDPQNRLWVHTPTSIFYGQRQLRRLDSFATVVTWAPDSHGRLWLWDRTEIRSIDWGNESPLVTTTSLKTILLSYFVGVQLFVAVRDVATLQRVLRATAIALLTAYTTYLLFPVYFERPQLEVTSLHTWLLSKEYLDKPYNHFPSLHTTLSWLAVHASQVSRRYRAGLVAVAIGISVSTLCKAALHRRRGVWLSARLGCMAAGSSPQDMTGA